ncbi:sigma-70 family RNA polymerase sigma factor [Streptomyces sp. NBC_01216]|uniref:sigma-70 family RNA polymerase sigma factor n=1 Tax=unclassified Streptomyces TaxID=2593676 RepID=UPI002E15C0B6|nr:sigma-70 family RNA polymerase sigma factor [Streptomyces sp. NBC_01216]
MSDVGTEESGGPAGPPQPSCPEADWPPAIDGRYWAFHAAHFERFLSYARYDLRSEEAAEAAVDATFRDLMRLWPRVAAMEKPAAYAWTVLKKRIIDQGRRRGRDDIPVDGELLRGVLDDRATGTDPYDALTERIALHEAIGHLPERQRDTVRLCFLLDQPTDAVAETLGVDEATVRSHLRLAKARLARLLRKPVSDSEGGRARS